MTDQLTTKRCIPCEGGIPPLNDAEIKKLMPQVPGWSVTMTKQKSRDVQALTKEFTFNNFRAAMAFLRQVEELAESEGHHPDFSVHYNRVVFIIWTHAIRGLHENDFILAAKIDQLITG
ncbi:MAG: 4a-hydroxytetrahydrobiopterin dehydratase [Candidatus Kerfeldbacteria bacterium]|nr:4a-hydroxytetrahydrobiopterin dehydratase [Candidatus Kerfeldbacteria bacterium]